MQRHDRLDELPRRNAQLPDEMLDELPRQNAQQQLRSELLAGLVTHAELCATFDWHWRRVLRYKHAGLPVVKLGKQKFYPIDGVRRWVMEHEIDRRPRAPGRPARKPLV